MMERAQIAASKAHRTGPLYRDEVTKAHHLRRALADLARAEADAVAAQEATRIAEAQLERFGGGMLVSGAFGAV
jgi:hypothetical protein